jgi:hypothetical protein
MKPFVFHSLKAGRLGQAGLQQRLGRSIHLYIILSAASLQKFLPLSLLCVVNSLLLHLSAPVAFSKDWNR